MRKSTLKLRMRDGLLECRKSGDLCCKVEIKAMSNEYNATHAMVICGMLSANLLKPMATAAATYALQLALSWLAGWLAGRFSHKQTQI